MNVVKLGARNLRYFISLLGVLLLIAVSVTAGYSAYEQSVNYHETSFAFDTEVYVEAHGRAAQRVVKEILKDMVQLDAQLNAYSDNSDIARINLAAGSRPVEVSPSTFQVIKKAIEVAKLTDGAFDPSVGPLVQLWGIRAQGSHNPKPSSEQISKNTQLVGYKDILLDEQAHTVFLSKAGMQLDLGAITKGYAVEKGVGLLRQNHIKSGLVAAGGNIYALGRKPDDEPWRIGIRNPKDESILGYIELNNCAVDSSGDYEQYYIEDGNKYSHIFDPFSGYPVTGASGTSVITDSPTMADALATALYVLGPEKGLSVIGKVPGAEGMFVSEQGDVHCSQGFKERLKQ